MSTSATQTERKRKQASWRTHAVPKKWLQVNGIQLVPFHWRRTFIYSLSEFELYTSARAHKLGLSRCWFAFDLRCCKQAWYFVWSSTCGIGNVQFGTLLGGPRRTCWRIRERNTPYRYCEGKQTSCGISFEKNLMHARSVREHSSRSAMLAVV